jgi:TRAP-type C4-dicarboxylate transport system permease large subunit
VTSALATIENAFGSLAMLAMVVLPLAEIVVPLIVPLGEAFGIHPVHLGIIFIANLAGSAC